MHGIYKTLLREIKGDLKKMERYTMFLGQKTQYYYDVTSPLIDLGIKDNLN